MKRAKQELTPVETRRVVAVYFLVTCACLFVFGRYTDWSNAACVGYAVTLAYGVSLVMSAIIKERRRSRARRKCERWWND